MRKGVHFLHNFFIMKYDCSSLLVLPVAVCVGISQLTQGHVHGYVMLPQGHVPGYMMFPQGHVPGYMMLQHTGKQQALSVSSI